jgi:hypothetical protein
MSILLIKHNYGLFSCCSVRLHKIVDYFNKNKVCPDIVNSSEQFKWYKPEGETRDITHDYFNKDLEDNFAVPFTGFVNYIQQYQFIDYKQIDYNSIIPFLKKYFSPSLEIQQIINTMEQKYNLPEQYNNICVLFHRGNDKATETMICPYEHTFYNARVIKKKNPGIRFLIQSDETEFIQKAQEQFPGSIVFNDEIRHMNKNEIRTVDYDVRENIFEFSKKYLAITIIMSKCKYIICGTGNCSIWIMLYRGNANNIIQYLNGKMLVNLIN